jgi:hypothetical protein
MKTFSYIFFLEFLFECCFNREPKNSVKHRLASRLKTTAFPLNSGKNATLKSFILTFIVHSFDVVLSRGNTFSEKNIFFLKCLANIKSYTNLELFFYKK